MAGSSFLLARSPVTPKSTRTQGAATRGILRSRGSRSGFMIMLLFLRRLGSALAPGDGPPKPPRSLAPRRGAHLGLDRLEQLVPRCGELLHALGLQHGHDVVVADAEGLQLLEYPPGLLVRAVDRVTADLAVGPRRVQRRLRHGVHRIRRD